MKLMYKEKEIRKIELISWSIQNNIRFYANKIVEYTGMTDKQVKQSFHVRVFLLLVHIAVEGVYIRMTPSVYISER